MKRILLVDDHAIARQALKLFLEHHGYVCEEAEHGADGLAWLVPGQHVALIVSDNHMPVMSGREFLVQVKASAQLRSIPFIVFGKHYRRDTTPGPSGWRDSCAVQTVQFFSVRHVCPPSPRSLLTPEVARR